jgi:hypothetical protein
MKDEITPSQEDSVKIAVMANDLRYVKEYLDKIDQKISQRYVTKEELALIQEKLGSIKQEMTSLKRLIFGVIGFVGIAVGNAIMRVILK